MLKHLTYENRVQIEIPLNAGASLAEIATALGKARSTIGREIRKHRQEKDVGSVGRQKLVSYSQPLTDQTETSQKTIRCSKAYMFFINNVKSAFFCCSAD